VIASRKDVRQETPGKGISLMTDTITTIPINQLMRDCIQHCTECHNVCTETTTYCLQQGGAYASVHGANASRQAGAGDSTELLEDAGFTVFGNEKWTHRGSRI
jgi:hypothetical protein